MGSGAPTFPRFGFTGAYTSVGDAVRQGVNSKRDWKTECESRDEAKQKSNHRLGLSKTDQNLTSGDDSRKWTKNGHAEGHTQSEVQRQQPNNTSAPRDNSNSSKEEPKCLNIHVYDDRVVYDHVFKNHGDCGSCRGEVEREGVVKSLEHETNEPNEELVEASKASEEERKRRDDHVRIKRDVECHEIVHHDASQCCRRRSEQTEAHTNSTEGLEGMPRKRYPWTAPRLLAKYLALRMQGECPSEWPIDDHDGWESWEEEKQDPPADYKADVETTTGQYHKMIHGLYQWEGMTDELIARWHDTENRDVRSKEWKNIQAGVLKVCERMYQEIERKER